MGAHFCFNVVLMFYCEKRLITSTDTGAFYLYFCTSPVPVISVNILQHVTFATYWFCNYINLKQIRTILHLQNSPSPGELEISISSVSYVIAIKIKSKQTAHYMRVEVNATLKTNNFLCTAVARNTLIIPM